MSINVEHLSFSYRKKSAKVIDDVSLKIEDGSINILLGLNGSGKTTLIKLLTGLLEYEDGVIQYGDKNLKNIPIYERSKIFAYVSQKNNNANDFKVVDYLTYGFANSLKFYQSPKEDQINKVKAISERLKITYLLEKNIGEISGGEKQVVSIASAVLQDTPVIILDEPTSALDLANQSLVLSILKEIANDGKTIILSSHNPNHALYLNSKVIMLSKGKILKEGNAKETINKQNLCEVYGDNLIYSDELEYKEITFR